MPESNALTSMSAEDAAWFEERVEVNKRMAQLSQHEQLACFDRVLQRTGAEPGVISHAVVKYGRLTPSQAEDFAERLQWKLTSAASNGQSEDVAFVEQQCGGHIEFLEATMLACWAEARWRIPIEQTPIRAAEMKRAPFCVESAFDLSGETDRWIELPSPPPSPGKHLIWATTSACEEIAHAASHAAPSLLSPDMFPVPSATVIFGTTVDGGSVLTCGALSWTLDTSAESPAAWVAIARPWMHCEHDLRKFMFRIPLGRLCEEFEDNPFIYQADRLLWAVLQIAQTPLAQRPKMERAAMRRADKRALSRKGEEMSSRIHVSDLRRPVSGDPVPAAERNVHAHWVQGHMRQHWWPSLEQHVPRWIQAHVRGNTELGWAPGHTPDGPPKKQVVWRVKGDADQSPQRKSRSAAKRRGRKVGAR